MTSLSVRNSKPMSSKNNIFLVWILIVLFTVALGSISYYELQREKNYLLELAHSEGLNIAFSIQALGSEFIVNRNVLTEILTLFQKEGVAFIDILDQSGAVRMSTDRLRLNEQTNIQFPGKINYFQIRNHDNKRTLQIIKPFEFSDRFSSDLFGFLFLRDKYLSIGINLEGYYQRYNQIKQRVILNYAVILIVLLSGIFMAFRLQENIIVKRTLQNMKDYTGKLLETMDSGVLSVDQKNIIRTINRKSEEIFQVRREEVLNRNAEEVVPIKIGGKSIYELGLVEGKKIEQETEIITKEGVHKILEINTSFLEGEKNQPGGMVVLIRDITRLKRLSEEINRNKRLVSLGQIASAIAHEIRNPLSSIRGLTQFLFQSCPDEEERKGDLKIIMKEVDRLNQLINQVLDFSRPKKLNISHFSLSEMIKDLINLLKLKDREKAVQFQLSLESPVQSIFADQDQIRQVLMNIILNAIQAVDSQGKIVIDLQPSYYNGKEAVLISIKDNGAGIGEEELSHIFDPFFTTGGQGTGLGLSIAYNIIEAHQGSIAISSEQGRGTEVKIFIPVGDGRKNE
ncbi:MAG: PAS domain S-box protein [Candidatus Atribacteria bacterium]|nr:PAS domain S-box protein [Candidatus Atribacteria bacterium]